MGAGRRPEANNERMFYGAAMAFGASRLVSLH